MAAEATSDVWIVDSCGVVRTHMSWLTPRARKAFVHLVGEDGLNAMLAKRKTAPIPTQKDR